MLRLLNKHLQRFKFKLKGCGSGKEVRILAFKHMISIPAGNQCSLLNCEKNNEKEGLKKVKAEIVNKFRARILLDRKLKLKSILSSSIKLILL